MPTDRPIQARAIPVDAIASPAATEALAHVRARMRLAAIDILRGLVIALMALDHVRDYFTDVRFNPLDLTQTSPELFFTRWITHFCAPIFIFLAGVSAWLVGKRCTPVELSRFLLTRGLWLVVLEFTVVNFAWTFNARYDLGVFLQVIWAIGVSMMVLSLLVRLRMRWIAAFAIVTIVGHNLLDGIAPETFGGADVLWNILHVQAQKSFAVIHYPLIPWVGVMALGYVLGGIFALEPAQRRRILLALGVSFIAAFVALRLGNGYGDPHPWSVQATPLYTFLSFIDVHKYPPSLLYVLMTLGPAMLLLVAFESARGRLARMLETFGRVPLFVYVLHIVFAHFFAGVIAYLSGYGTSVLTGFFLDFPAEWGFGLPVVYLAWLGVLVLLYPLCKWFAGVKKRRSDWWLSYL